MYRKMYLQCIYTGFQHLIICALKGLPQNQKQILYMANYLVFSMQKQNKIVQDKIENKIWLKYKKTETKQRPG